MNPLLTVTDLDAFYGDFQALYGVSLQMQPGEVVALIGANGAGKSTFLKALTGLVKTPGQTIEFLGENIAGAAAFQIARKGIALSPEGRRLFPSLSVQENLMLGATVGRPGFWTLEKVYDLFPALEAKKDTYSTLLSGGQQQMVAIGRALMSNPELLALDEVSLGLAPVIVKDTYAALPQIRAAGAAVLMVEQDIGMAMEVSDRLYCFQEGRVSLQGPTSALTRETISQAYFGRTGEAA